MEPTQQFNRNHLLNFLARRDVPIIRMFVNGRYSDDVNLAFKMPGWLEDPRDIYFARLATKLCDGPIRHKLESFLNVPNFSETEARALGNELGKFAAKMLTEEIKLKGFRESLNNFFETLSVVSFSDLWMMNSNGIHPTLSDAHLMKTYIIAGAAREKITRPFLDKFNHIPDLAQSLLFRRDLLSNPISGLNPDAAQRITEIQALCNDFVREMPEELLLAKSFPEFGRIAKEANTKVKGERFCSSFIIVRDRRKTAPDIIVYEDAEKKTRSIALTGAEFGSELALPIRGTNFRFKDGVVLTFSSETLAMSDVSSATIKKKFQPLIPGLNAYAVSVLEKVATHIDLVSCIRDDEALGPFLLEDDRLSIITCKRSFSFITAEVMRRDAQLMVSHDATKAFKEDNRVSCDSDFGVMTVRHIQHGNSSSVLRDSEAVTKQSPPSKESNQPAPIETKPKIQPVSFRKLAQVLASQGVTHDTLRGFGNSGSLIFGEKSFDSYYWRENTNPTQLSLVAEVLGISREKIFTLFNQVYDQQQ